MYSRPTLAHAHIKTTLHKIIATPLFLLHKYIFGSFLTNCFKLSACQSPSVLPRSSVCLNHHIINFLVFYILIWFFARPSLCVCHIATLIIVPHPYVFALFVHLPAVYSVLLAMVSAFYSCYTVNTLQQYVNLGSFFYINIRPSPIFLNL